MPNHRGVVVADCPFAVSPVGLMKSVLMTLTNWRNRAYLAAGGVFQEGNSESTLNLTEGGR